MPTLKMRNDKFIYILIIQLALLLDKDWKEKAEVSMFLVFCNNQEYKIINSILKTKIDLL